MRWEREGKDNSSRGIKMCQLCFLLNCARLYWCHVFIRDSLPPITASLTFAVKQSQPSYRFYDKQKTQMSLLSLCVTRVSVEALEPPALTRFWSTLCSSGFCHHIVTESVCFAITTTPGRQHQRTTELGRKKVRRETLFYFFCLTVLIVAGSSLVMHSYSHKCVLLVFVFP